jgi:transposase
MHRRTLELTSEQRSELVAIRDRDRRAYLRERAAALLQIADGASVHHVALHGLFRPRDPDTVYDWLNRYQQDGIAGLVQRPRRPRGLSP